MTPVGCIECLNKLARVSLASRIMYPPQCGCGKEHTYINIVDMKQHLDACNRARLEACQDEFTSRNPTWCFVPTCSAFLRVDDSNKDEQFLVCGQCGEHTCSRCKGLRAAHTSPATTTTTTTTPTTTKMACPDLLSAQDRALVVQCDWKQCPHCRRVIDRSDGCDHMTCPCGTVFCWGCLHIFEDYNNPDCPCYNEDTTSEQEEAQELLAARARDVLDARPTEHPESQLQRNAQV